jgi:hypothetical protein
MYMLFINFWLEERGFVYFILSILKKNIVYDDNHTHRVDSEFNDIKKQYFLSNKIQIREISIDIGFIFTDDIEQPSIIIWR